MRVYIAGPKGEQFINVRNAVLVGQAVLDVDHDPFIPHLCAFWSMITGEADYEKWMNYDMEWLKVSDVLVRMPGESSGADREVARAKELHIPIITMYDLDDFGWLQSRLIELEQEVDL